MQNIKNISVLLTTFFALQIFAAGNDPIMQLPNPPMNSKTVEGFLNYYVWRVLSWMFTFLVIFAIVYVMIAAWKYLTAAGDPKKAAEARGYIWYAAIALAIAILAKAVPFIVASFMGVDNIGNLPAGN